MKSKATVYILLAIIVIVFHEFILAMGYTIYLTSKQIIINDVPETFNNIIYKNDNRKAFDEYIKSNYGIVSETFELKNHYNRFWHISAPFIEKEFSIQLVKGKVLSDNFSEVLATDPKFQHMYSNWVKKQVGIEDENVELRFYGQQSNPKMTILFNEVKDLNNNYDEIFINTKFFYCSELNIRKIMNLNEQNSYDIAIRFEKEYFEKIKELIGNPPFKFSYRIGLSNNEFSKSDLNIYYRSDYNNIELSKSDW